MFLADMLIDNFKLLFSDQYYRQETEKLAVTQSAEPPKCSDMLSQLPETFTRDDLKRLSPKAKNTAISMMLRRWVDGQMVEKTGNGYKKI